MGNDTFYVYGHFTKDDTNTPFYIGKGSGNRCNTRHGRNAEWHSLVKKRGLVVKILYDNLTESAAFAKEIELIKQYGRKDLNEG